MTKDILKKIASIKSALDSHRPFPDHIVKQHGDYYYMRIKYEDDQKR